MKYPNNIQSAINTFNNNRGVRKKVKKQDIANILFFDKDYDLPTAQQLLSNYISGRRDVPLRYARKLAEILKCQVDDIA